MSSKAGHQVGEFIYRGKMSEKCSQAGHQVGKFIYRGRNTGEYPQKLVTKLANLFIREETLVNVLKSWLTSWQVYLYGKKHW